MARKKGEVRRVSGWELMRWVGGVRGIGGDVSKKKKGILGGVVFNGVGGKGGKKFKGSEGERWENKTKQKGGGV